LFAVRRPRRVADRDVLLVDDVVTTGATASRCAEALLSARARSVTVAAAAR
jgi:predicted amidophosphoribosyltransferase